MIMIGTIILQNQPKKTLHTSDSQCVNANLHSPGIPIAFHGAVHWLHQRPLGNSDAWEYQTQIIFDRWSHR